MRRSDDGPSALVLKASSMGDVIHTLPAVHALTQSFGSIGFHWLVNTEWAPLLETNEALGLASVIRFPRRDFRGLMAPLKMRRWAQEHLAPLQPDLAIDFQGLLRSALLCKSSGAREVAGFSRAREGAAALYDQTLKIPDWDTLHAVDRYRKLAAFADADLPETVEFPLPEGEPIPDLGFDENAPFLVLHPFSRGAGKSLSVQETIDFCAALPNQRIAIVGVGNGWSAEEPALPENAVDLLGRTSLTQLIWLMRRADRIVSVDSGPMHLAAAITDRVLSIHTWTNPRMVGPYPAEAHVWRDEQILRVGEIAVDQFPENRRSPYRRKQAGERLLPLGEIDRIAAFCSNR